MSDFGTLAGQFNKTPMLLVDNDNGTCRLIARAEGMRVLVERPDQLFKAAVIIDMNRCLRAFGAIVGREDRDFGLTEICSITATVYSQADAWLRRDVFRASVADSSGAGNERRFAWRDAFIAGVVAALRRQGVGVEMLKKVSRLLYSVGEPQEPKETKETAQIAVRSPWAVAAAN